MLKPAFVNSWITHLLKRPKKAVHCPVWFPFQNRPAHNRPFETESSEICYTKEDFLVLKELLSPFSYKLQMKSRTETVLRTWDAQMNLEAQMCKDEIKRELITEHNLNHNPRSIISSLCDISINLLRNNTLWRLALSLSSIYEQNTAGCTLMFCPATN